MSIETYMLDKAAAETLLETTRSLRESICFDRVDLFKSMGFGIFDAFRKNRGMTTFRVVVESSYQVRQNAGSMAADISQRINLRAEGGGKFTEGYLPGYSALFPNPLAKQAFASKFMPLHEIASGAFDIERSDPLIADFLRDYLEPSGSYHAYRIAQALNGNFGANAGTQVVIDIVD